MNDFLTHERLMSLMYAGIATVVALTVLWIYRAIFPWIEKKVFSLRHKELPSLRIRKIELISGQAMISGVLSVLRGLRVVGFLVILYLYLSAVFSFFQKRTSSLPICFTTWWSRFGIC